MKTIYDDPRLTAYVLGELGPRDRARFEQEMAASPELRQAVEEMKESASLLGEALPLEAADLGLSYAQRELIHRAMGGESAPRRRRTWLPLPFAPGWNWAGAALVVALGAWLWVFTGAMGPNLPDGSLDDRASGLKTTEKKESGIRLEEETDALAANAPAAPRPDVEVMVEVPAEMERQDQSAVASAGVTSVFGLAPAVVTAPAVPSAPSAQPVPQIASGSGAAKAKLSSSMNGYSAAPARRGLREGASSSALAFSGYADAGRDQDFKLERQYRDNRADAGGEAYEVIRDNPFKRVADVETGTSTFGADVDTASYSNVRRFLQDGQLPPREAVRIEELLNYFTYNYPASEDGKPFATSVEIASAPWAPRHRLVRVGIRAKEVAARERRPMNLVFLVDVSGSMSSENKLPLVQKSLRLLTRNLAAQDRVALVVYAGSSGLVLDSTADKTRILEAIERLQSGGSTNGAGGIQQAYAVAREHFIKNGINRVILCTDGDFNVGITDRGELIRLIEAKREEGVFLNIYGFGMGNLKDATLEQLANKGNGTYGYIDGFAEAQKVFSEQLSGTLVTVAKDVKFQIEFNPAQVAAWRQIGYENRQLAREDFNDDRKDAGEVGAGHTVTVLYEIVPVGVEPPMAPDAHRYLQENQKSETRSQKSDGELLFLKIRYKEPAEDTSKLLSFPVRDRGVSWEKASEDFKFAASVASFGMLLRESPHAGRATWEQVLTLGRAGRGGDEHGHRAEYLRLVELARSLSDTPDRMR